MSRCVKSRLGRAAGRTDKQTLDTRPKVTEGQTDTQAGTRDRGLAGQRSREAPARLHSEQEPGCGRAQGEVGSEAQAEGGQGLGEVSSALQ